MRCIVHSNHDSAAFKAIMTSSQVDCLWTVGEKFGCGRESFQIKDLSIGAIIIFSGGELRMSNTSKLKVDRFDP